MKKLKFSIFLLVFGISSQLFGQNNKLHNIELKTETEIEYIWDNSSQDWLKSAILDYDYSSTGNLSRIVKTDAETNDKMLKIDYYYTSSSALLAYEIYEWTPMGWLGSTKYSYNYNNDKLVKQLIQIWNNGLWQNNRLDTLYIYDINDLLVKSTNFRWKNDGWLEDHVINYEYDEKLNVVRKYSVSMSNENLSQVFYSYNPDGTYNEMYAQFYKNGQWENGWRRLYEYDKCGNLLSVIRQSWVLDEWINNTKSVYIMGLIHNGSKTGKVVICHKGHTITVSVNAVEAHLKHGDCIGECIDKISIKTCEAYQENKEPDKKPFEIFPNPAKYQFVVKAESPLNLIKKVEVIDMNGNIVRTVPGYNSLELQINRNSLKDGKYFVKITGNEIITIVVILN